MRHALPYWCALYGALLVQALWGGAFRRDLGLKLSLGFVCGLGLAGLASYTCTFFGAGAELGTLVAVEVGLLLLSAGTCLLLRRERRGVDPVPRATSARPSLPVALLSLLGVIALGCAVYTSVCTGLSAPFGFWDALASWNLKARFLFLDAQHWEHCVSDNRVVAGADYPLLIPCLVARGYTYAGGVSEWTAALLGPLFSYGALALLFFAGWNAQSLAHGLLAGLFWLGTPEAFQFGAAQYGDTPVGAYFLATLVVLAAADRRSDRRRGLMVLAGLLAGMGAFVKHEGQMFLVILVFVRFLAVTCARGTRSATAEAVWFAGGCLPGLAAVLSLRTVSDATGFFAQNAGLGAMLAKLLDTSKYAEIAAFLGRAFVQEGSWAYGGLLLVAAVLGWLLGSGPKTRAEWCLALVPLTCVVLALCGYFAIFLMTPMDLTTHLTTTAFRFCVQVYPATFFAFFLLLAPAEEALERGRAPLTGTAQTGDEPA